MYILNVTVGNNQQTICRYMKEQSQAPDLQEREMIPEREYQRVTISGEEKCGVSQSHCRDGGWTGRKYVLVERYHNFCVVYHKYVTPLLFVSSLLSSFLFCSVVLPSRFPSQICWMLPNVWWRLCSSDRSIWACRCRVSAGPPLDTCRSWVRGLWTWTSMRRRYQRPQPLQVRTHKHTNVLMCCTLINFEQKNWYPDLCLNLTELEIFRYFVQFWCPHSFWVQQHCP